MSKKYPNSGALFKNERKEKDTHPDLTGTLDVDGKEYWLSAWSKVGEKGKWLSISIKPKEASNGARKTARVGDLDDDIPW